MPLTECGLLWVSVGCLLYLEVFVSLSGIIVAMPWHVARVTKLQNLMVNVGKMFTVHDHVQMLG